MKRLHHVWHAIEVSSYERGKGSTQGLFLDQGLTQLDRLATSCALLLSPGVPIDSDGQDWGANTTIDQIET
eukprot:5429382-Alexandrium_andersonii.AAC.1